MEVHHHPDLHHKPKKLKEYFLEFLMIFLAVLLGFIAENLREHISNRSKEKEYMEAFVHNLQDDTARLQHAITADTKQVKGIDSFLRLKHLPLTIDSNRKTFYYLAIKYFYNSATFKSNDATLQQLKSTGDYRLIVKDHVADSLSKYDANNEDIYNEGAYYEDYFKQILSMFDEMVDMTVFGDSSYIKNYKFTDKPLPAVLGDSVTLRKLFSKALDLRGITDAYINYNMQLQLDNATKLIAFLKKEYNLE